MDSPGRYSSAVQDFKRARSRASLQQALSRLGGNKRNRLLSFDQVRRLVGEEGWMPRGLQDIPINAIVGSVGRYEDFNREFLPRQEAQLGRWAQIRMLIEHQGVPPIEVYKIGDVYFVQDGHHRVSVARETGATHIEAYVTEIPTRAPLSPRDDIEDVILKAELAQFLKDTRLGELRPDVDFRVTLAGRIRELRDHIAVHRYFMGLEQAREVPFEEAVLHWVDEVYVPAVTVIRNLSLLRDFPDRTEADMYLWLMKHRAELAKDLGWELGTEEAAAHLWNRLERLPRRFVDRVRRTLARKPVPTEWRLDRGELEEGDNLFPRILVPLSGEDASWTALDQAIVVAKHERSELRGMHVLTPGENPNDPKIKALSTEFDRRIAAADLPGRMVTESGGINQTVLERSHWSDLVVLHLKYPPGDSALKRLMSGLRNFIQRSPRPVLVVPKFSEMKHVLLAYDGSGRADEAMYLAAHLNCAWGVQVTVLTSSEKSLTESLRQRKARSYLTSQDVNANYVQARGAAGPAIVETALNQGCDFVLMGGYGQGALLEVMIGSTVDHVLREFPGPVWICA
jgi:nucleotide-binding universal stress UspA family protein